GSESLVRVILDNVPTGVVVTNSGSDYLGDGKWVIVVNPAQGKMDSDTFTFDVSFQIHSSSHGAEQDITITVLNEDSDNGVNTQASTNIHIKTDFLQPEDPVKPAEIKQWELKDIPFVPTEDTQFTLAEVI